MNSCLSLLSADVQSDTFTQVTFWSFMFSLRRWFAPWVKFSGSRSCESLDRCNREKSLKESWRLQLTLNCPRQQAVSGNLLQVRCKLESRSQAPLSGVLCWCFKSAMRKTLPSRCVSHTLKECVGYHTLTKNFVCGTLDFSKIVCIE